MNKITQTAKVHDIKEKAHTDTWIKTKVYYIIKIPKLDDL